MDRRLSRSARLGIRQLDRFPNPVTCPVPFSSSLLSLIRCLDGYLQLPSPLVSASPTEHVHASYYVYYGVQHHPARQNGVKRYPCSPWETQVVPKRPGPTRKPRLQVRPDPSRMAKARHYLLLDSTSWPCAPYYYLTIWRLRRLPDLCRTFDVLVLGRFRRRRSTLVSTNHQGPL